VLNGVFLEGFFFIFLIVIRSNRFDIKSNEVLNFLYRKVKNFVL